MWLRSARGCGVWCLLRCRSALLEMCRCALMFCAMSSAWTSTSMDSMPGPALGLPRLLTGDYRDQPELYYAQAGLHKMPDQEALRAKLPDNCDLITGDVGDTVRDFHLRLDGPVVAFAAYDLDLYSSTMQGALPFLTHHPARDMPCTGCSIVLRRQQQDDHPMRMDGRGPRHSRIQRCKPDAQDRTEEPGPVVDHEFLRAARAGSPDPPGNRKVEVRSGKLHPI